MPHVALSEPASAVQRKINWQCSSEAGGRTILSMIGQGS